MKVQIDVSDECGFEVDVPPGGPRPRAVSLDFDVFTEDEFRDTLERLGGARLFNLSASTNLQTRYGVPLTADGERIGSASLQVWLKGPAFEQPKPVLSAVQRLKNDLAKAEVLRG